MAKLPSVSTTALANCRTVGALRTSPKMLKRLARKIAIVKKTAEKYTNVRRDTGEGYAGGGRGAGRDIHLVLPEPSSCLS